MNENEINYLTGISVILYRAFNANKSCLEVHWSLQATWKSPVKMPNRGIHIYVTNLL